jgi:hypothetical protein
MPLRKRLCLIAAVIATAAITYSGAYFILGHRESSRARGAGEYFHYRDFNHSWEVYFFAPAAYLEGQMIQINPKPFLSNPSWAQTPQRLVIRVPGNDPMFWFPPFPKEQKDG